MTENGCTLVLLLLLLLALLLGHAREPVKADCGEDIEDDEGPQDAKVAPALVIATVDLAEEDVGAGVRAETAGVPVVLGARLELAEATIVPVLVQVFVASLVACWREFDEFIGSAGDRVAGEADAEHAGDEVGERRESVHEDPEAGELAR